jgi:putative oxidoreductase
VYVGEVVAPLFVILGAWTRPAALVIAINMIVAVGMAHMNDLFSIAKTGGYALELQAMYLFSAIAIALLGAGRYSLAGARGRWN